MKKPHYKKLLNRSFYLPSSEIVAHNLLGQLLISRGGGSISAGIIVETEAYLVDDPASHSYGGKTKRNALMFGAPGRSYVYFIYGNHFCFNAVCCPDGIPEAVLIRAVHPVLGEEIMAKRRMPAKGINLTNGPGKLCAAMGINRAHNDLDLCSEHSEVYIAENPNLEDCLMESGPMVVATRIGISKAADLPLRFYLKKDDFVSRKMKPPPA